MSDDIPFDKSFDLAPGIVDEVAPGVRRMLRNNPSPFTFKGTVSYIVGRGHVAIIDPGPLDEAHIAALLDAVRGETVTHIFVTHTHRDHSPAVPRIKAATGRRCWPKGRIARRDRSISARRRASTPATIPTSSPTARWPTARSSPATAGRIEAVTTPGHTANHMAFALKEGNLLFSGDHVMAWSTPIVAPPDGAMSDYMASLREARAPLGVDLPARPWRRGARGAALRAALHPPSPERARLRSCTGSARAKPIFRPLCARSISVSIRG